jgi:hypothetical protein
VVTLAATVVGVYITVIDRPTWTADDWRQQANAVCERDTAKLTSLINFLRLDLAPVVGHTITARAAQRRSGKGQSFSRRHQRDVSGR